MRKRSKILAAAVSLAVLAGASGGFPAGAEGAGPPLARKDGAGPASAQIAQIEKLFEASGLKKDLQRMNAAALADGSRLQLFGLPPDEIVIAAKVYSDTFDSKEYYRAVFRVFETHYDRANLAESLQWFLSPLGRKIVAMEVEIQGLDLNQKVARAAKALRSRMPSKKRFDAVKKLERALEETRRLVVSAQSQFQVLSPLDEGFGNEAIAAATENLKGSLLKPLKERVWLSLHHTYDALSDDELSQFVSFAGSPPGQWFYQTRAKGALEAQKRMEDAVEGSLAKIVAGLKSEKDNLLTLQQALPPGIRFLFVGRRDPFKPIFPEKKGLAKFELPKELAKEEEAADETKKAKVQRFGPELKVLTPIPLEIYKRLKDADPIMYGDLEHYARLFRNEKEVYALSDREYLDAIAFYKELIQKAGKKGPDVILSTPLQTPYESLKLAGVLWNGMDPVALFETPDKQGHTVRKGTILGPNYGVVESIDQVKVAVVERQRDFKGAVLSQTREVELYPNATTKE
ncbi:MAG: pilus assembly protein PilP [Nitrospinae bacterium]|nr:pilus assembly protein PilP [Nitrospinota bacterium]